MSLNTQPLPEEQKASFGAWWMLAILLVFYIIALIDRSIVAMLVTPIKADLALTDFEISIILGPAFALVYAVAGLPFGWAADRYPRRRIIFAGMILWSIATAAGGLVRSFGGLLAARMAVGVGESALSPCAYTLIADKFPRGRLGMANAIYQTGAKLGPGLAYTIGGVVIAAATALSATPLPIANSLPPWQLVLIMVGAPGALLALLAFSFKEPARHGEVAGRSGDRGLLAAFVASNFQLMFLMLAGFAMMGICINSLTAWVPTFMDRKFGWAPIQYGPALGLISLISASFLVIKGGILDWLFGRGLKDAHIRFYTWLLVAGVPIGCLMFFAPDPWLFLVGLGVFDSLVLAFMFYFVSTVSLIAPNRIRGQLTAIFLAVVLSLGSGVGPMIVGGITTYILKDDQAVGTSLSITIGGSATLALILLRLALKWVKPAILRAEKMFQDPASADDAAAAPATPTRP